MCGIAGIINFKQSLEVSKHLMLMTNSMKKRGPDDEGYLLFNSNPNSFSGDDSRLKNNPNIRGTYNQKYKLGFGFRQLKIIDLSDNSHQPMTDSEENYWIIFNGEIYNFKEIRNELTGLGHHFFSESDTEVALKSYMQWGSDCLQKFNGMFAIAIFDKNKNKVFIARDRIGIKPLYYYKSPEHFIFASTQKSIIDSTFYTPEINWEGLSQNFRFSIAQRPNTCFQNINAIEPGHFLIIDLNTNKIQKTQYWEIPTITQDFTLTEKKSIQLVEESLYNAVKFRLIADVEVGTFMSGGIDSTTISVLASKLNQNIKALTLGFNDYEQYNEVSQASDTANLNNLNHIIKYAHPNEIIKKIKDIIIAYEEPYHHLSANYILAKMASENKLKVVLSGLGGDELFGGYDVFNKLRLWDTLKKNKSIINLLPNIHPKISKAIQLANYKTIDQYYSHYYTTFSDYEIEKLFKTPSFKTENTISNIYNPNNLNFTDDFEAISFYNLKSYIGNHQMRAVDQSTMNFSIEGRLPLLDHNLIETVFKIPSKYKIKNGVQKYILKEIARKHIAPSCISMKKKGLALPLEHWIKYELKEFTQDAIHDLKSRSIFNSNTIDTILKSNDERKIWQLVSTELWIKEFIK